MPPGRCPTAQAPGTSKCLAGTSLPSPGGSVHLRSGSYLCLLTAAFGSQPSRLSNSALSTPHCLLGAWIRAVATELQDWSRMTQPQGTPLEALISLVSNTWYTVGPENYIWANADACEVLAEGCPHHPTYFLTIT